MRGRKPLPTKLKLLTGNPGKQKLPQNEPEFNVPADMPKPPETLHEQAKDLWFSLGNGLHAMGMLHEASYWAFVCLCDAVADLRLLLQLQHDMEEKQPLARFWEKAKDGRTIKSKVKRAIQDARLDVIRYGAPFGLTPADAARLGTDWSRGKSKSKFAGLIGGSA